MFVINLILSAVALAGCSNIQATPIFSGLGLRSSWPVDRVFQDQFHDGDDRSWNENSDPPHDHPTITKNNDELELEQNRGRSDYGRQPNEDYMVPVDQCWAVVNQSPNDRRMMRARPLGYPRQEEREEYNGGDMRQQYFDLGPSNPPGHKRRKNSWRMHPLSFHHHGNHHNPNLDRHPESQYLLPQLFPHLHPHPHPSHHNKPFPHPRPDHHPPHPHHHPNPHLHLDQEPDSEYTLSYERPSQQPQPFPHPPHHGEEHPKPFPRPLPPAPTHHPHGGNKYELELCQDNTDSGDVIIPGFVDQASKSGGSGTDDVTPSTPVESSGTSTTEFDWNNYFVPTEQESSSEATTQKSDSINEGAIKSTTEFDWNNYFVPTAKPKTDDDPVAVTNNPVQTTTEFDWNNYFIEASPDNTGGIGSIDIRGDFS